jgi:hypothetical protein
MTLTDLLAELERADAEFAAAIDEYRALPKTLTRDKMDAAESRLRKLERAAKPVKDAALREAAAARRMLTKDGTPIIVYSAVDALDLVVAETYTAARSATDVALEVVEVPR